MKRRSFLKILGFFGLDSLILFRCGKNGENPTDGSDNEIVRLVNVTFENEGTP